MIVSRRIPMEPVLPIADRNIRIQYPIQKGTWIAHPGIHEHETSFCVYTLTFRTEKETVFSVHVSADQRFELFCDGTFVGMGPDRNDVDHWAFHVYELTLPAGEHTLRAEVAFLHEHAPHAQNTHRPAFILVGENAPVDLDTGSAPWRSFRRGGVGTAPPLVPNYHVIGPSYTLDGARWFDEQDACDPVRIAAGASYSHTGAVGLGWKLFPSRLPEQVRRPVGGGRIRVVADLPEKAVFRETPPEANASWQRLIDGAGAVTVPPRTRATVLWDCEEYHCAYPEITLSGGAGAKVTLEWAESCFEQPADGGDRLGNAKGDRNAVDGKRWLGFGDTFLPSGAGTQTFRPPWWRSGRYIRIVVETAAEPLVIGRIGLLETRLPFECESTFDSDDGAMQGIIPVAVRGIQMCAHETYMDCPYYEQMMYVGDTRLQMLTAYIMSGEDSLNRRGIELFDWSRQYNGFVLARHPSMPRQLITPFSMIWILMVRDYAWWRADAAFVRERLLGARGMLEEFRRLQGDTPLLAALPGWTFMDWVPGWDCGYPPEGVSGTSCMVNLLFLNALGAAAEMEDAFGDAHHAADYRAWAARLAASIRTSFWDTARDLFADDLAHTQWSEHAQCLALLSGRYPDLAERCFAKLIAEPELHRATVYFSFYLLETFARFGRGDLIHAKLDFWKNMVGQGFKTPVEAPEPSRSDCHAWGSHPLFHMHASLAGIRPDAPGFARVRIAPSPGSLARLASTIPHPAGTVSFAMERKGAAWQVDAALPVGVPGVLVWRGKETPLAGSMSLTLDA